MAEHAAMSEHPAQVAALLRACTIESTSSYSWFGRVDRVPSPRPGADPETARARLVAHLQRRLYTEFYCPGSATRLADGASRAPAVPVRVMPFVEQLSAANRGTGHRDRGWLVLRVEGATAWLGRNGLEVRADLAACSTPSGAAVRQGDEAWVQLPKESRAGSRGFYVARGDAPLPADWATGLRRLYWNVTPAGAVRLLSLVSRSLNRAQLPFLLKVWANGYDTVRCDTAVLYVHARDLPQVSPTVTSAYPELDGELRHGVPALTKALAPGLGFAQDPGGGDSFGMHRCRLLSEALVRAREQRIRSLDGRLHVVTSHFAGLGIELERPYLNAGERDESASVAPAPPRTRPARAPIPRPGAEPASDVLLRTAHDIGRCLIDAALWHEDRCTWVGARPGGGDVRRTSAPVDHATLGPDLYSGTGGVALFLAELYRLTGDESCRRTALGAVRQSLSKVGRASPAPLGLYTGWPGVAYGAARVGALLDDGGLLERARTLVLRCRKEYAPPVTDFDLLSGAAGAIVALLSLDPRLHDEEVADFTTRLGRDLVLAGQESPSGLSWPRPSAPDEQHLTGLSHGAAGAALALLELYDATASVDVRRAAELALAYERQWFDAGAGNWADLRGHRRRRRAPARGLSYAASWCHGAPGIALSRLHAYHIMRAQPYRAEALRALETTRDAVRRMLDGRHDDFSLCHGVAGNAEVLLNGSALLGAAGDDCRAGAHRVAEVGIERYGRRPEQWPSGVQGGWSPTLMLGLAGVGHFYLRLHDPGTASVLLVTPRGRRRLRAPAAQ